MKKTALILLLGIFLGAALAWMLKPSPSEPSDKSSPGGKTEDAVETWTCSMHPEVRQPDPGQCPKCAMDLIPLSRSGSAGREDAASVRLSPDALKRGTVDVAPVQRRAVHRTLRVPGRIAYNQSRRTTISARFDGRIDRLFVDYEGMPVETGQHLASIYSPELLTAQEEYLQALRARQAVPRDASEQVRNRAGQLVEIARDKLRLMDLTPGQIEDIAGRGRPREHITFYSPAGGVVERLHVEEGDQLQRGDRIATLADLDPVWIWIELFEDDLPWVAPGMQAHFSVPALPGASFTGRVAFLSPEVSPRTRTVRARMVAENPEHKLKPGMLVRAEIVTPFSEEGRILAPELAGKYISPMHPEIVKDEPGTCDICGMDLVPAEELGYAAAGERAPPLTIPESAALLTGSRAVVYVHDPHEDGVFRMREVLLGPRADGYYVVRRGLQEGERVASRGAFLIDSEAQLAGNPSMMSSAPEPAEAPFSTHPPLRDVEIPESFASTWTALLDAYIELQERLADDDNEGSREAAAGLARTLPAPPHPRGLGEWMDRLQNAVDRTRRADTLNRRRDAFEAVSTIFIEWTEQRPAWVQNHLGARHLVRMNCPMAFDFTGADWLQLGREVYNPYFGDEMLHCGTIERDWTRTADGQKNGGNRHDH